MEEKAVCANIEKLVHLLNAELEAAYGLGLRVHIAGGGFRIHSGPERIELRVWRETTMVQTREVLCALDIPEQ